MRDVYCDYCKKKIDKYPDTEAIAEYYPKKSDFAIDVQITICTGMDLCCECAEKGVRKALNDNELKERLVKLIIDPPTPPV